MKHKNLLVENNVNSVKQRLITTLQNINFQGGKTYFDDIEKIEHCIKALENIKIENNNFTSKPTKIKRNTLKSILKRFILSDLFIKVFVYTSAFILTLLLTLEI